jgi:hypothetical protein
MLDVTSFLHHRKLVDSTGWIWVRQVETKLEKILFVWEAKQFRLVKCLRRFERMCRSSCSRFQDPWRIPLLHSSSTLNSWFWRRHIPMKRPVISNITTVIDDRNPRLDRCESLQSRRFSWQQQFGLFKTYPTLFRAANFILLRVWFCAVHGLYCTYKWCQ